MVEGEYNDDCIYTPGVKVFKSDTGYPQLLPKEKWYSVNVLTCAAPNLRERLGNEMNTGDGNHDEKYLWDKDFDVFRFEWAKDYAEIHDNKWEIVLMHYPIFCYNGQFRRGADGTPLTYMLHGHIHKTPEQELVDRFCTEIRATRRKTAHQEEV